MINADSYYEIGAGHMFCQDYATAGKWETNGNIYHYAVVSDGCSGAKTVTGGNQTDIGARILAKALPRAFDTAWTANKETGIELDSALSFCLAANISSWAKDLGLDRLAFDATVVALVYEQTQDILHCFCFGDGKIFLKGKDDLGYLTDIKFKSNAPFYLNYITGGERLYDYERKCPDFATIESHIVKPDKLIHIVEHDKTKKRRHYERILNPGSIFSFASVFSDGIDTYHKVGDVNTIMPAHNVYNQMTQYKNIHGSFVERRMQMVKKFCQKEGWQHFDDISVATITF